MGGGHLDKSLECQQHNSIQIHYADRGIFQYKLIIFPFKSEHMQASSIFMFFSGGFPSGEVHICILYFFRIFYHVELCKMLLNIGTYKDGIRDLSIL